MAKKLPEPEVGWARISERALSGNVVAGVNRVSQPVPGSLRPGSGVPRNDGFGGFLRPLPSVCVG